MSRCRALGLAAVLLGLTVGAAFAQTSLTWTAGQLGGGWYDISTGIAALLPSSVAAAAEGRRLTLLPCPQPLAEHLARFGLGRGVIPAETYPKAVAAESVSTATMGTTIIVSAAMADGLAYTITKTLNDNADRVRKLHESLADYDPSRGWLHLGVPLHPGAERYYREKGWLHVSVPVRGDQP